MQARRTIVIFGFYFILFEKNKVRILYPHHMNYTIHIKGNKTEFLKTKVITRH